MICNQKGIGTRNVKSSFVLLEDSTPPLKTSDHVTVPSFGVSGRVARKGICNSPNTVYVAGTRNYKCGSLGHEMKCPGSEVTCIVHAASCMVPGILDAIDSTTGTGTRAPNLLNLAGALTPSQLKPYDGVLV